MRKQIMENLATLIISAFGLVAALAWNDTIKTIFEVFLGKSDTLTGMLTYSVLVTILAVFVTIQLGRVPKNGK